MSSYLKAMEGNPVTIRFLDPPLHEFVPQTEEDIKKLADAQGKSVETIKAIIESLKEFNYDGTSWMPSDSNISRNRCYADKSSYPCSISCTG